jgi:hypothetical protein
MLIQALIVEVDTSGQFHVDTVKDVGVEHGSIFEAVGVGVEYQNDGEVVGLVGVVRSIANGVDEWILVEDGSAAEVVGVGVEQQSAAEVVRVEV